MNEMIQRQHEIDNHLTSWVKKNEPSHWMRVFVVFTFGSIGMLPYWLGGSQAALDASLVAQGVMRYQPVAPLIVAIVGSTISQIER